MRLKTKLSFGAKKVLQLLAEGYAVSHGSFLPHQEIAMRGMIYFVDGRAVRVSGTIAQEIKDAGIELYTYEHNIAQGWKSVIPIQQRAELAAVLAQI